MFRDYLRANPAAKDQYQALKFALIAEEFSHEKNNSIYVGYTLGKHDFINNILKQAGFNKHRFVFCTHYSEIKAAQYFRTNYFFAHNHIKDPGGWTFNSQYHKHMVFYQGVEIIGYAHIQLWSDKRAALRIIVIDLPKRNNNFGSKFLQLIEKWLKNEGYKSIHTEVTQTSLEFYRKNGYVEMKFNDPDRYKCGAQDVALGKIISHDV
jgi:GNAT superfamily N-acetyltransferase